MYKALIRTLLKYGTFLGWVLRDLATQFPLQWLVATVMTLVAPFLQALAFLLLSSFVVAFAQGTPIQLRGIELDFATGDRMFTVWGVSGLCTALFLLSTLTQFIADKLIVDLRSSYTQFSLERGIHYILRRTREMPESLSLQLISLVRRDAIYCGRVAALAAAMGSPLLVFIISTFVALWLYPGLTTAIGVLALSLVRSLHKINVAGSRHSLNREHQAPEMTRELRSYVQQYDRFSDTRIGSDTFGSNFPKTANWLQSQSDYLMVVPLIRLVTGFLSGFSIGIIIVGLGIRLSETESSLGTALVYLIALKYMVSSFRQVTGSLSALNRFYAQTARYHRLLKGELPATLLSAGYGSATLDEEDFED